MRLILASSSPRRRQLLSGLGLRFDIIKPQIDESRRAGEAPMDYVQRLSRQKAAAAARQAAGPLLVIAADTIVLHAAAGEAELLGKPRDADDARQMLRRLRGRRHQVCTAFTLHKSAEPPQTLTRRVCTAVWMRAYSDAEIDAYIASGDPFDKAGAYAIQNAAFYPAARIEGSRSNVVGLPLDELKVALAEIGCPLSALPKRS